MQQCEVGISSTALDRSGVQADRQHESEWCWAATIAAAFTYYHHPIAQERIVQQAFGRLENTPGQPQQILAMLNRVWVDDAGRPFAVQGDSRSANLNSVIEDLATNHPAIVGTLGHATLLTEMLFLRDTQGRIVVQRATVRDPWPYNAERRALSAKEWQSIAFVARVRVQEVQR